MYKNKKFIYTYNIEVDKIAYENTNGIKNCNCDNILFVII